MMRALDLFCGAGGATRGLQRAGFHVTGVDLKPQPRYCGDAFVQADALAPPFDLARFDFVWASPPCQAYSVLMRLNHLAGKQHPRLIDQVRRLLEPCAMRCIENVPGAPLRCDVVLEGGQFDLDIIRRRHFEVSGFPVPFALARQQMRKVSDGGLATVAGKGANNAWNVRRAEAARRGTATKWRDLPEPLKNALRTRNNKAGWMAAMGIDWMSRDELAQSVPPAYAEFIGRAALEHLRAEAA